MFGIREEFIDKNPNVPQDIIREAGIHANYDSIFGIAAGTSFLNKFDYVEKFVRLNNGVRFNVETLPTPLERHKNKGKKSRNDIFRFIQHRTATYYAKKHNNGKKGGFKQTSNSIRLEAVYQDNGDMVYVNDDGFLKCCITAFAQHLPLALAPDHIWTLITYAFQKHVSKHSEELRNKFVKHQGKVRLLVETPNAKIFAMSTPGQPDTGATAEMWEKVVFSEFAKQIASHTGPKLYETVTAPFSTTTPSSQACSNISLMASMKDYFSYGMGTPGCGIPEITLLGTVDDWFALRERTEALGKYMTDMFSHKWLPHILPVLDNFVQSASGNVHHGFWQSMVKFRGVPGGSGMSKGGISGWIQLFYPYLEDGKPNLYLRPWNEMYYTGHDSKDFPAITSSTPVDWKYVDKVFDITFHTGFTGFSQDNEGRLSPNIGWYVTYAPDPPPGKKIKFIQEEILALLKSQVDKKLKSGSDSSWTERINHLLKEEEKVLNDPFLTPKQKSDALEQRTQRKEKYNY